MFLNDGYDVAFNAISITISIKKCPKEQKLYKILAIMALRSVDWNNSERATIVYRFDL